MLALEEDVEVVGQAGTAAEARPLLTQSDVVIIDLQLPDANGLSLIRDLRAANPMAAALVVTASLERTDAARSVAAGASGYIHKAASFAEILHGVRHVSGGGVLWPPSETMELLRLATQQVEREQEVEAAFQRLTPREYEVLEALAKGLSDKEIATQLEISVETARRHVASLLSKLDVSSRLQALVLALRHGVVTIH